MTVPLEGGIMKGPECHHLPIGDMENRFATRLEKGLTQEEAGGRLREHGPNELTEKPRPGFLQMLLSQFNNFLVIILIVAFQSRDGSEYLPSSSCGSSLQ
jgi:magnesium-transporting ATPase (P-type)